MNVITPRRLPTLLGVMVLVIVVLIYLSIHPRGLSSSVVESFANSAAPLAFAAIAQTFPVLTGGLDLSIGGIVALTNAIASLLLEGSPVHIIFGVAAVIFVGAICGAVNGCLVVYGKLQPIIATLATGAVFSGSALLVRPFPGGGVDADFADAMTSMIFGVIPVSTASVLLLTTMVWYLVKRTSTGRGILAAGSARQAANLSGLDINTSIIIAYVLSGLFAAIAGLFLAFQTLSGDATIGVPYTINSIAAIVIGGLSLRGGFGSGLCAILGAHTLRGISAILLFSGAPPLAQPLFEGLVLVVAVTAASIPLIRNPDRLKAFR